VKIENLKKKRERLGLTRGYTNDREKAPAAPPEAMLAPKKDQNSVFGLYFGKRPLKKSLEAKLRACHCSRSSQLVKKIKHIGSGWDSIQE
jgi:hypothetical protein